MITSRLTPSGVLIIQPSGPITAEDFAALAAEVDPWLDAGNELKGLLIDAPDFPGWKDLAGLSSHFKFVRDHHRRLTRVAFVSDSRFLSAVPKIARHFVQADIRQFDAGNTAAALAWIESPPEKSQPSIRHAWFPNEKVMWVTAKGKITTHDYRKFLATIEEVIAETSPISFLVNIDDLEGVEIGAMVSDLRFGLTHIKHFKRIAMVGNEKWTQRLASLPNPFSLEIKAFDESHEHEAWDWLTA